jgi:hypothetical protein
MHFYCMLIAYIVYTAYFWHISGIFLHITCRFTAYFMHKIACKLLKVHNCCVFAVYLLHICCIFDAYFLHISCIFLAYFLHIIAYLIYLR